MSKEPKFRPQRQNANKHTQRGQGMLETSIGKDGFIGAMTAAADGEMFDGSLRLETVEQLFNGVEPIVIRSSGDRPVVHIRTDIPNADDARAKRLAIAANRIAEVSLDWDVEVRQDIHDEIDLSDFWLPDEIEAWDTIPKGTLEGEDDGGRDRGSKEVNCTCPSCGHQFIQQC